MGAALKQDWDAAQAGRFSALAERMEAVRVAVARDFDAAGHGLSSSYSAISSISQSLDQLAEGFRGEAVTHAYTQLRAVVDATGDAKASILENGALVQELGEQLGGVDEPLRRLQRAIETIVIVAVNARIAASEQTDGGSDLLVFTEGMKDLTGQASDRVAAVSQQYAAIGSAVVSARAEAGKSVSDVAPKLNTLSAEIGQLLDALDVRRAQSSDASALAAQKSQQISGSIATAVGALQCGDSAQQRLEHIVRLIAAASALLDQSSHPDIDATADAVAALTEEERAATANGLARVAKALAQRASNSLSTDVERACGSISNILSDVDAIRSASQNLYGDGEEDVTLEVLNREMTLAIDAIRHAKEDGESIARVAATAKRQAVQLTEEAHQMRDIEFRIGLVSMNATVRCARMGDAGRALSVIANQIRELSVDTKNACDGTVAALEDALKVLQLDRSDKCDISALDQVIDDASAALQLLERLEDDMLDALKAEHDAETQLRGALETALANLQAERQAIATMGALTAELEEATSHGVPAPDAAGPVFDALRRCYTIEDERQIHDQTLGRAPAAPLAPPPGPAAAGDDEDDLDDMFL